MSFIPSCLLLLWPLALTAQTAPKTWRVSERPILSIGSRDGSGPDAFGGVVGAVRLSTGTVVVADRMSKELRFFSSTGAYLRTSGRDGEGPGEFRAMASIQRCAGDSVFVYDHALYRLSVFSPEGAYARDAGIRKWSPSGLAPFDFWCNPAQVLVFLQRPEDSRVPPRKEGPLRQHMEVSLVVRNDSAISLGTFLSSERYFKDMVVFPMYLGRETTIGVGSRSIFVGTGDAYEVAEYSLRGERIGGLREPRAPVPITAAEVTAYINGVIARARPGVNTSAWEANMRAAEWPRVYPAYRRLMVDWADNLWIEEYPIPGQPLRGWGIYARGAKVATISLPSDFRLLEAGRDYVLGVWRDEFDVDYVRVYSLLK